MSETWGEMFDGTRWGVVCRAESSAHLLTVGLLVQFLLCLLPFLITSLYCLYKHRHVTGPRRRFHLYHTGFCVSFTIYAFWSGYNPPWYLTSPFRVFLQRLVVIFCAVRTSQTAFIP